MEIRIPAGALVGFGCAVHRAHTFNMANTVPILKEKRPYCSICVSEIFVTILGTVYKPDMAAKYGEKTGERMKGSAPKVRFKPEDKALVYEVAKLEGLAFSKWAEGILVRAAKRVLAKHKPEENDD